MDEKLVGTLIKYFYQTNLIMNKISPFNGYTNFLFYFLNTILFEKNISICKCCINEERPAVALLDSVLVKPNLDGAASTVPGFTVILQQFSNLQAVYLTIFWSIILLWLIKELLPLVILWNLPTWLWAKDEELSYVYKFTGRNRFVCILTGTKTI